MKVTNAVIGCIDCCFLGANVVGPDRGTGRFCTFGDKPTTSEKVDKSWRVLIQDSNPLSMNSGGEANLAEERRAVEAASCKSQLKRPPLICGCSLTIAFVDGTAEYRLNTDVGGGMSCQTILFCRHSGYFFSVVDDTPYSDAARVVFSHGSRPFETLN